MSLGPSSKLRATTLLASILPLIGIRDTEYVKLQKNNHWADFFFRALNSEDVEQHVCASAADTFEVHSLEQQCS